MFVNEDMFIMLVSKKREDVAPDNGQTKESWQEIWSKKTEHKNNAEWSEWTEKQSNTVKRQADLELSVNDIKNMLRIVPNWEAQGLNGVRGFWLKQSTSLHELIHQLLQICPDTEKVPKWTITGRTTLITKDPGKGNHI